MLERRTVTVVSCRQLQERAQLLHQPQVAALGAQRPSHSTAEFRESTKEMLAGPVPQECGMKVFHEDADVVTS